MSNQQLIEADAYFDTLLQEVPKAKKRVVIAAMIVLWGARTAPIFIMLQDALKRGVKVTILLDNYTRLPALYGLTPRSTAKERVKQTMRALEELSAAGATVHCFGKIGFPPYKGRCHVKITVIDDDCYSFGGVNFFDQTFTEADYMLRSKNTETADCLEQLVNRIGKTTPPLNDGEVPIDAHSTILFDGGKPGHSIIYERACELTAQAKRVYFVSQMTPSGQLARLLNEVNATIYFNRPEQMQSIDGLAQAFDQQKYRITNSYQGNDYIHAKYLLFEMQGGKKVSLTGSNNFSYRGVSFGTQEIALHSTDPKLWQQLYTFLDQRIAHQATKGGES